MIETIRIKGHALRASWLPGERRGVPLLLCNGWGGNIEVFDPLVAQLEGRPVLRFDVPGIGGSPLPEFPLRMPTLASLVEGILDHYNLEEVDVAGYSWGGALAQALAKRNPRRVRKLILIATSPGHIMVPAWPDIMLAFADRAWLPTLVQPARIFSQDLLCRVGHRLFGGDVLRQDPKALLPNLRQLEQPSVAAMAWQLTALFGWSSLPWLARLAQPTLVLVGTQDRVVNPLNAMLLTRLIPNAQLQRVHGGHLFPILDSVDTTAGQIIAFLDAHPKVVPLAGRRKQPSRRAG